MIDNVDREIIQHLQNDGRKAFTDIAREMGLSEGTIRNRVARLLEERTIQVVGMIDPNQMGFDAPAMIGVQVEPARVEEIASLIAQLAEVSYLITVSGEFDMFVEVLCKDRNHLAKFLYEKLMRIPGVLRTQTFITLRTYKMAYAAAPSLPAPTQSKSSQL